MEDLEDYRGYKITYLGKEDAKDEVAFIIATPNSQELPHLFCEQIYENSREDRIAKLKEMIDCVVDSGYKQKPISFWNDLLEDKGVIWKQPSC